MSEEKKTVRPGFKTGTVIDEGGKVLVPPADWAYLPAGDGPLTRKVKSWGPYWQVQVEKGRRTIAKGIWAPAEHVDRGRREVESLRASPAHQQRLAASRQRREVKQQSYVEEFYRATLAFLDFDPCHRQLAERLAEAVASHATPVGSGTVARTERIPLVQRVEAAVIAWMRHNTTAYDQMQIARIKGRRREVRRMLAQRSQSLLAVYRRGEKSGGDCPLAVALKAPLLAHRVEDSGLDRD